MQEKQKRTKLITSTMKLKDVFPDLASDFAKELDQDIDDLSFVRKGITPANLEIKEGERAVISYITTAAKDRDGEIVLPSGAMLAQYRKNPVVLFGHNYGSLPIGKNMWIKADEKGLIAKTQYASEKANPFAEQVYQYRKEGFPLAESIGFIPVKMYRKRYQQGGYKWNEGDLRILEQDHGLSAKDVKDVYVVFTKWILLEYSDVSVPANPEATQIAIGKGLILDPTKLKLNKTVGETAITDEILEEDSTENGEKCIKGTDEGILNGCDCPECKANHDDLGIIDITSCDCTKDIESIELPCGCPDCITGRTMELAKTTHIVVDKEGNEICTKELGKSENLTVCGCKDCKDSQDELDGDEFEGLLVESTNPLKEYTDAMKELVCLGLDPDAAVKALQDLLKEDEEIGGNSIDELDFDLEEKELEFDLDTPTKKEISDTIDSAIKTSISKMKKGITESVTKVTKDTIDRLKGKIIARAGD